jgi:hypothetical protein
MLQGARNWSMTEMVWISVSVIRCVAFEMEAQSGSAWSQARERDLHQDRWRYLRRRRSTSEGEGREPMEEKPLMVDARSASSGSARTLQRSG